MDWHHCHRLPDLAGHAHFPWIGIIATDCQTLLDTLNGVDELEQNYDTPLNIDGGNVVLLDVLIPDWDVLIEIQRSLDQLPRIKLAYVKGHQGRDAPYAQLNQMAQLNVDADAKAGQYQDKFGAVRSIAKLMSQTGAHLVGPEGTITAHYQKNMRYQATEAPLREYLMAKYHWMTAVFNVIHWEAHGAALKKVNKRRIHYTKMMFDILPTNSQANKYDKGKRTCPTCDHSTENRDHILRCGHSDAITWRADLKSDLTEFYSLRASGAMALWLSGHGSPEAIMKMGRWRTQTFLTYTHSQEIADRYYLTKDGAFSQFPQCEWVT